ncbi:hypothetical protein NYS50_07195 [Curtobacterium flaccumfaciens pv. flaccumfaciens]|uniref:hypothetical protein n=1 Tax=Curtobacterium flaccumfaciens TaxID=2035 RepID=UPI00217CFC04|nr:hypothetical protein [Curtobacterium flaccumfaciens]MCS6547655.1 hypothetical protein [Curtobacterium flaccumfaciens pv. flaccumfaciens]
MSDQGKLMMTSEAHGTFTITRMADDVVLGRMTLDDFEHWHAWYEDGSIERRYLGEFEDDGDAIAAIREASDSQ